MAVQNVSTATPMPAPADTNPSDDRSTLPARHCCCVPQPAVFQPNPPPPQFTPSEDVIRRHQLRRFPPRLPTPDTSDPREYDPPSTPATDTAPPGLIEVTKLSARRFRGHLRDGRDKEVFSIVPRLKDANSGRKLNEALDTLLASVNEAVRTLLEQYREIFRDKLPPVLPPHRDIEHAIDVDPAAKPPFRRLYQLSPAERAAVRDYITTNKAAGKIHPSSSPYGLPLFFPERRTGHYEAW